MSVYVLLPSFLLTGVRWCLCIITACYTLLTYGLNMNFIGLICILYKTAGLLLLVLVC